MNLRTLLLLTVWPAGSGQAQNPPVTSVILNPTEVAALLPEATKQELSLAYPIFRVYKNTDKTGVSYCVLLESRDRLDEKKEPISSRIKAVTLRQNGRQLTKSWELNDFLAPEKEEQSIWFWTKFASFQDYDHDAVLDPILVYGTAARGADDGRIKVIIYYRGQKIALRHQAGDLDIQRNLQVDKAFYTLPAPLQAAVRQKLALLEQRELTILPHGWQQAMTKKATFINDSYYSSK
ncbi:M949_RS01915 family surface polysaccharide biosynthesis protein [Hymenobacter chitinivorans]|uniref:Uncharacterized protein n=1 Tax=Hymenobacter chitinivorans DSM 11115 TaxID=1121954 RepID=A0A2M9BTH5_9BACT|nr:hypothetical protein [Hymenobacter chitinivorans]PJJ61212.1 hypothetical protein CLV45_2650 [Hymenobacter chitinivorans DSM 11115]